MKNKDKYDLRKFDFKWKYDSYNDLCGVSVFYGNELIARLAGNGYSPIIVIMDWLESECEEND